MLKFLPLVHLPVELIGLLCAQVPELPSFMLEPLESHKEDNYRSGPPSYEYASMEVLSIPNPNDTFSNVKVNKNLFCYLCRNMQKKYLLYFYDFRTLIQDRQHNCVVCNMFYLIHYFSLRW